MQPYRVSVNTSKSILVLAAMMSVDKQGRHRIYIVSKHDRSRMYQVPGQLSFLADDNSSNKDLKNLAHELTTPANSEILARYDCVYGQNQPPRRRWWLYFHRLRHISVEYTLQDCLKSAMKDFCKYMKYTIIEEL